MVHCTSTNVAHSRASSVMIDTRLFQRSTSRKRSFQRLSDVSISCSAAKLVKNFKNIDSFAASYLINSFGFTAEKAISASKHLHLTQYRADSVVALLKERGFTQTQIHVLVHRYPKVLASHPEENLLPKFEFFSSVGLSTSEITKMLTAGPRTLGSSLHKRIIPSCNWLRDLLQSDDRTRTVIKRYASMTFSAWNFQAHFIPNVQILQEAGVPQSRIVPLLTLNPGVFLKNPKGFEKLVYEVKEMGFDPDKANFMKAICAIRSIRKATWEKKVEVYEKWGWSKDEISCAFRNDPFCMTRSEEKINKIIDFLVNKMSFKMSAISKDSLIMSLSLEKRIVPRCSVYQYLLDRGFIKTNRRFSLSRWLMSSEVKFVDRLKRYEKEVPNLLQFYHEQLDHANEA